jgi:hypothetical protein
MSDFDLIRWDTPFADTLYPSVIPVPNFPPVLSFAVAPDGIDNVFHVVFLPEQMEQLANADEARIRIDGRVFDLSAASTSARALLTHTD